MDQKKVGLAYTLAKRGTLWNITQQVSYNPPKQTEQLRQKNENIAKAETVSLLILVKEESDI